MDFYYTCFFVALFGATVMFYLDYKSKQGASNETSPEFKAFQKSYLMGYLFAMAGDWLQGPYVYALYSSYGYEKSDIATLFVAGFGSSMIFGTCVGSWADKLGRRKMAFVYCLVYIGSCCTKHFSNYWVLMLGRVLGGISTSLVYSIFDSWMVSEHTAKGFDPAWMKDTFSKAMIGNSCVAIASGVVAEYAASVVSLSGMDKKGHPVTAFHFGGYTAPFDVAIFALLTCLCAVSAWDENYGTVGGALSAPTEGGLVGSFSKFMEGITQAYRTIVNDRKIFLIGCVCSLFEGSMFTFVFMWTPVIGGLDHGELPFGLIFATFMLCCMMGSSLFNRISSKFEVSTIVTYMLGIATVMLSFPIFGELEMVYLGFLAFEVCVGVYWPGMGTMKGMHVPDTQRSAIYNVFRVPLNLIVLFSLEIEMDISTVFTLIVVMLGSAAQLSIMLAKATKTETAVDVDPEAGEGLLNRNDCVDADDCTL